MYFFEYVVLETPTFFFIFFLELSAVFIPIYMFYNILIFGNAVV